MPLDVNQLSNTLVQVFQDGMSAASSDEVARALAQAIHDYVSAAVVDGIEVDVVDGAGNPLGTGSQRAPVTIS